jgi:hypothetical protein
MRTWWVVSDGVAEPMADDMLPTGNDAIYVQAETAQQALAMTGQAPPQIVCLRPGGNLKLGAPLVLLPGGSLSLRRGEPRRGEDPEAWYPLAAE